MDTARFGWTVLQSRMNGSVDFYRGWCDYEIGFGNLKSEYCLGDYKLYIHLEDFEGNARYAEYSEFSFGDATTQYTLNIDGYSGNAGDSLTPYSGMMFSTYDKDNDINHDNCAQFYKGAWRFRTCHDSELNGEYLEGEHHLIAGNCITLEKWTKYFYSLKSTRMMIKRHKESRVYCQ